jgi:hypothetical protein
MPENSCKQAEKTGTADRIRRLRGGTFPYIFGQNSLPLFDQGTENGR